MRKLLGFEKWGPGVSALNGLIRDTISRQGIEDERLIPPPECTNHHNSKE